MDGKKVIIVAEDEPDTLLVMKSYLEAAGLTVLSAVNGEEVLNLLKSNPADLIVLDIMMPVLDGFSLNKQLKKDPRTREIPVIITTAKAKMRECFENTPDCGIAFLLEKPFRLKTLLEKIREIIG